MSWSDGRGGWDELAVVILRNKTDYNRTQTRIEISKGGFFATYSTCTGNNGAEAIRSLSKAFFLFHLTDWTSFYLSEMNHVDVMEISM